MSSDFHPSSDPHLSIDDPHCMNKSCHAFEIGFNASEDEIPLLSQLEYGKWVVYVYGFFIVLFMSIHFFHIVHDNFWSPLHRSLTPLVIALAGKVNIITWMTGICYSKLNVFHRYAAYVLCALATVHTIPHFVAPVKDGGWDMLRFLYDEKRRELSGTPLYAICIMLVLFSIPWARNRAYEIFAYTHVFLAICYLAILYWHIKGEYMSSSHASRAESSQNELVFLVRACTGFTHTLASYVEETSTSPTLPLSPTSTTSSSPISPISDLEKPPLIDISALEAQRSRHHGASRRKKLANGQVLRAMLDGPYGSRTRPLHRLYDTVVCVAGGSGITAALPWLLDLSSRMRDAASVSPPRADPPRTPEQCLTRTLRLVWVIRHASWLTWARGELSQVLDAVQSAGRGCSVVLDVYVTGAQVDSDGQQETLMASEISLDGALQTAGIVSIARQGGRQRSTADDIEKVRDVAQAGFGRDKATQRLSTYMDEMLELKAPLAFAPSKRAEEMARGCGKGSMNLRYERPDLGRILPGLVSGRRAVVLECGPESMKIDVSNILAALQKRVLSGDMCEIALHSETFGW
ncbi:ferric reductase like transmembrane component-domain-containing protein [Lineolata rhizophorae]|uniref:Ferric reductase like transmembrane component-domain-containing protein n=1 Tax=Lineolata rhizophorae TaxID=578093 RepID=A0A6A6NSP4_9PEZI|nr:ferric reductase like transmembrane component-domain-containing protein [Lineolata rhizophorae]